MAPKFESILDTPVADVERPKPMPAGTYDCIVRGLYEQGESSKKKTPFVKFTYAFQAALDDVDEDELREMLTDKDGNVTPLTERTIKDTYYTTPDALFRLTDALEAMGIEDLENKTIRQSLSETPNCPIRVVIGHRASEDGETVFAEVKKVMKPE
jgi:hypothetical protein